MLSERERETLPPLPNIIMKKSEWNSQMRKTVTTGVQTRCLLFWKTAAPRWLFSTKNWLWPKVFTRPWSLFINSKVRITCQSLPFREMRQWFFSNTIPPPQRTPPLRLSSYTRELFNLRKYMRMLLKVRIVWLFITFGNFTWASGF